MQTKWMVHPEHNMVMVYNEQLVKEFNYRPYDGPLPVIDKQKGFRVLSDDCLFESDKVEEIVPEVAVAEEKSRVERIVEAMQKMPKMDFLTANGMPNLTVIKKIVKFEPTMEEREEAFKIFTEKKSEN